MERLAKVSWTEGMLLRPQHFQQQDRFHYLMGRARHQAIAPNGYGLNRLSIETHALTLGQFGIAEAEGIMPDGMPFRFDSSDGLTLEVPSDARDERVFLVLRQEQQAGLSPGAPREASSARYAVQDVSLADESLDDPAEDMLELAYLNPRLRLEREDMAGYVAIPVARILEVSQEQEVRLDRSFVPPSLNISEAAPLAALLREILGMVEQRAKALAVRMQKGTGQSTTLFDVLMLQALNRAQPLLQHLAESRQVHPERLYEALIALAGDMATFTRAEKRPARLPPYRHEYLTETFGDLTTVLSQSLSTVLEQKATALKLEEAQFGIRVAPLSDKSVLESAQLVLAVKAELSTEEIRRRLPAQIKLGAVEHIRSLVNNHLPGIGVSALPVAPRQIPYHAGYHYFLLDAASDQWEKLKSSGGLAVHVSGNYPGLELELWAIRQ